MINDLTYQYLLWDRKAVLAKLRDLGIPTARSFTVLRGDDKLHDVAKIGNFGVEELDNIENLVEYQNRVEK